MTQTTHLALPFIDAAQAQKHVTHNEALQLLDALVQLSVGARNQGAPPVSPSEGQRFLVGAGAAGAFVGKDFQIATFLAGAWTFLAPQAGWRVYVEAEQVLLVYDGAAWGDAGRTLRELQNLNLLGLGTTADANNPLSAKLNAALFTAKSLAEGGTGDLRFTLNKSASGNTVSQLYQDNYSGRAETGLTGDDHFHVKVSADGATWKEAINIDPASAIANFPNGTSGISTGQANGVAGLDAGGKVPLAQLSTLIGDAGAGGTKGLAPAPAAGDAAAGKFLKADGTWAAPAGAVAALLAANNLSDLVDAATARNNLFGAGFSWDATNKALTLGGATVTTSNPIVNGSQTWNAAGVVFKGLSFNATKTAANVLSGLIDVGFGGNTTFRVGEQSANWGTMWLLANGAPSATNWAMQTGGSTLYINALTADSNIVFSDGGGVGKTAIYPSYLVIGSANFYGFSSTTSYSGAIDTALYRDAAGVLALRNGTAAQSLNIYNTYTDASNYEALQLSWSGNFARIRTSYAGTGFSRSLILDSASTMYFDVGGLDKWQIPTGGHFLASIDNSCDIGANGANRPRNVYIAGSLYAAILASAATTVASLPSATTTGAGARAFVTDAAATTFLAAVAGGGANKVPVVSDGTSWLIG